MTKTKAIQAIARKKVAALALMLGAMAVIFFVFFISAEPALAQAANFGLEPVEQEIGLPTDDIRLTVARIIRGILGLLGIVAVLIVLYGGYTYMTSGGDPEKVNRARKILINGGIGLVIILLAFAIVSFVLGLLERALTGQDGGISPADRESRYRGAFGVDIIEYHYPGRGEMDIPRNTNIMITFREPISPDSIMDGAGMIVPANVSVRTSDEIREGEPGIAEIAVRKTDDDKTFVFDPIPYLGNDQVPTDYTVTLANLVRADGDRAFTNPENAYSWSFQVSTLLDFTPPKIVSVVPPDGSQNVWRNQVVRIDFDEPIDATSASGSTERGFQNIRLTATDSTGTYLVQGLYRPVNQYRSIEFITFDLCARNTCGGDVYCLPSLAGIEALAQAGILPSCDPADAAACTADEDFDICSSSLGVCVKLAADGAEIPSPHAALPPQGITDRCNNSLDGNGNGIADGQPADNYLWSFSTSDQIDVTGPWIVSGGLVPDREGELVNPNTVAQMTFNETLYYWSVNQGTVSFVPEDPNDLWPGQYFLRMTDDEMGNDDYLDDRTTVWLDPFGLSENASYVNELTSGLMDSRQNCYNPSRGPGCETAPQDTTCDTRP